MARHAGKVVSPVEILRPTNAAKWSLTTAATYLRSKGGTAALAVGMPLHVVNPAAGAGAGVAAELVDGLMRSQSGPPSTKMQFFGPARKKIGNRGTERAPDLWKWEPPSPRVRLDGPWVRPRSENSSSEFTLPMQRSGRPAEPIDGTQIANP